MSSSSRLWNAMRHLALPVLLLLAAIVLQGCATEADGVMPWATPEPGEGSVIPSSMIRR
ncbi:MAG: hypothetical protein ACOYD3_06495 [Kiritimatiellia bacterium]|jgi:hypothetical protein